MISTARENASDPHPSYLLACSTTRAAKSIDPTWVGRSTLPRASTVRNIGAGLAGLSKLGSVRAASTAIEYVRDAILTLDRMASKALSEPRTVAHCSNHCSKAAHALCTYFCPAILYTHVLSSVDVWVWFTLADCRAVRIRRVRPCTGVLRDKICPTNGNGERHRILKILFLTNAVIGLHRLKPAENFSTRRRQIVASAAALLRMLHMYNWLRKEWVAQFGSKRKRKYY